MKLKEFRTQVALLTQKQLAEIAGVAESTIYLIEKGKPFNQLTKGRVLSGLTKHLGRTVQAQEIDEFSER